MTIQKDIYQKISNVLSINSSESGGLLGGDFDIVSKFYFDKDGICDKKSYIPDIRTLTVILQKWKVENIEWLGMVHSHQKNQKPSESDLLYVNELLKYKVKNNYVQKFILGIFVISLNRLYLYEAKIQNQFFYTEIRYNISN